MQKKVDSGLFSAILYIVIGVLLMAFPGEMINWAMTIAGVFFLVSGILEMVKKNWAGGAVSLIIGLSILVLGWALTSIVLLVLGVLLAVKGVVALIEELKAPRATVLGMLFAVLTIAIGVLVAFGGIIHTVVIIGGALLAVDGILGLIAAWKK